MMLQNVKIRGNGGVTEAAPRRMMGQGNECQDHVPLQGRYSVAEGIALPFEEL